MNTPEPDHDTWVYHALHEPKIVKTSEAVLLYKQGWRDSPDPKILFKGVRGKLYKIILSSKSFQKSIAPHWDSYKILMALIALTGLLIAIFKYVNKTP